MFTHCVHTWQNIIDQKLCEIGILVNNVSFSFHGKVSHETEDFPIFHTVCITACIFELLKCVCMHMMRWLSRQTKQFKNISFEHQFYCPCITYDMYILNHVSNQTYLHTIVSDHDHLAERFNLFRRYITLTSCNFLSLRAPNPLLYQSSSWRNATRFRSNQSHKIHLSLWLFRSGYVSTYSNVQFDAK